MNHTAAIGKIDDDDSTNQSRQIPRLTNKTENLNLYTEKVHLFEHNMLKEILLVIYDNEMSFIFLEKDIQFMRPINIITDIDRVIKCSMARSNNYFDKSI